MNRPLCSALHPLSFEFACQLSGQEGRAQLLTKWRDIHGPTVEPPPLRAVGEHPMVASVLLQQEIDRHVGELTAFLASSPPGVLGMSAPDVVSADLAITVDPDAPEGWTLRWVEFQAFTSIISTIHTLHLAAESLWPASRDLTAWNLPDQDISWLLAVRNWAAPRGGVLLEHSPDTQTTRFDLQVASRLFELPIVEPHQLVRAGRGLTYKGPAGEMLPVPHIFNRMVMHELADRKQFENLIADADVTWHSHPAGYYRVSKAWLPRLPQRAGAQCAYASEWRSLGLPAEALVAKNVNSHGGGAVHLHITADMLDALDRPETWIVQPRYTPHVLFSASDGAPVFGEIRCVIANPCSTKPWISCQFLRLSRGNKVSAAGLTEAPGSGMAVLYRPPGY